MRGGDGVSCEWVEVDWASPHSNAIIYFYECQKCGDKKHILIDPNSDEDCSWEVTA